MSPAAAKLTEHLLHAVIDDGAFWLDSWDLQELGEHPSRDDPLDPLLEEALENGLWIAQGDRQIMVVPPQQWSRDRPLTVETWTAEPPNDLEVWEDVWDASIIVGAAGLAWVTNFSDAVALPVPPGTYRVRIAGRGAKSVDTEQRIDEWRLQFWAHDPVAPPLQLRTSVR